MAEGTSVNKNDIRKEVEQYLDNTFPANIEGYIYSPTLDRSNNVWAVNYFPWPTGKEDIVNHVLSNTKKCEVYVGPALYKSPDAKPVKENVIGSKVVWTEFDGKSPSYGDIPMPHYWIQSSSENHVHVYWTLDSFCEDLQALEDANRALTYNLGADSSGWDATQILRFPLTINQKRKKWTSTIRRSEIYQNLDIAIFGKLPKPAHNFDFENFDFDSVPYDINAMAWSKLLGDQGKELFFKPAVEQGNRSTALMALAYCMAEQINPVLTIPEMVGVLYSADEKWGKFKDRADRKKRLLDIATKAREKYPHYAHGVAVDDTLQVMYLDDLMADQQEMVWAIPGLLQQTGLAVLSGQPGCGKTTLSLQLAMHMACGKDFLGWEFDKPVKVLFVSMEMPQQDIQFFMSQMLDVFDEAEQDLLRKNFGVIPIGYGVPIDTEEGIAKIEQVISYHKPYGVFMDSLGVAVANLKDEVIRTSFDSLARLREQYHCFFWLIHHNRKAQIENKKPYELADLFGSQYIGAGASTALIMYQHGSKTFVKSVKVRMGKPFDTFQIDRIKDTLNFKITMMKALEVKEENNDEGEGSANRPDVSDFD